MITIVIKIATMIAMLVIVVFMVILMVTVIVIMVIVIVIAIVLVVEVILTVKVIVVGHMAAPWAGVAMGPAPPAVGQGSCNAWAGILSGLLYNSSSFCFTR